MSFKYSLRIWRILFQRRPAISTNLPIFPVTRHVKDIKQYYKSKLFLNIINIRPIMELLGSSETGGPMTAALKGPGMRQGSVGKGYPHFETAILNPDKDGVGEIITRGRNVFMGYVWDEDKTNDTIDKEGWVHSGDLGRIDQDGFFYMAGRMKEVLITGMIIYDLRYPSQLILISAGGENVAPVPIEEDIKSELVEIASHVMVVGDKKV